MLVDPVTYNSLAFNKLYDNESQSVRANVSAGVNLPREIIVRTQSYTDSTTKLPGTRTNVSVGKQVLDANNVEIAPRIYLVAEIPGTAAQGDVDELVATFRALVADTTNNFLTRAIAGEK